MSAETSERVRALFAVAAGLEGAERERYLARACDDPAVRAEVRSLLDEPVGAEFLREPLVAPGFLEQMEAAPVSAPPQRVGAYRIIGELGEGTAGVVYLAEQEGPVRRTVALKMLHPGGNSRRMMSRFRAEARALAAMDHPQIARLFDAGTGPDGRLYFVMEHVRGEPITGFFRGRRPGLGERLRLLAMACAAVQHAHGKGVIHRDLKPSNILAFDGPEGPSLKIIDFGIAKVAAPDAVATSMTEQGAVLGTLPYMSPEQIDGRADARSDVYSLGALAYEVLTGRLPITLDGLTLSAAIARVRDEPPPAAGRLDRALRGDAESVLARALAKDPERRYASADALGAELRRLERGEPVLARGTGAPYVLATLARRHRRAAGVLIASVALLVAGLGAATAGLVSARRSGSEAEAAERRTAAALAFTTRHALGSLDGTAAPRAVRTRVAERLDADTAEMLRRRPDDPELLDLRAEVLKERSRLLLEAGEAAASLELRKEAAGLRERAMEGAPGDADLASGYSIDLVLMGDALGELGDRAGQRSLYQRAADLHRGLSEVPGRPIDRSRLAWSCLRLGAIDALGSAPQIALLRESLSLSEGILSAEPDDMTALDCARQAHALLGESLKAAGELGAGQDHADASWEIAGRLVGMAPDNRLYAQGYLHALLIRSRSADPVAGAALEREGYDRARRMLVHDPGDREALDLGSWFARRLAQAAAASGDADGTRAMLRDALDMSGRIPGAGPDRRIQRAVVCLEAARLLSAIGEAGEAAQSRRDCLAELRAYAELPQPDPEVLTASIRQLIETPGAGADERSAVVDLARRAVELGERPGFAAWETLGRAQQAAGDAEAATASYRRAEPMASTSVERELIAQAIGSLSAPGGG